MADVFKLAQSDVERTATMFNQASTETGDLIARLKTEVDSLAGGWEGDSYNAFQGMFTDVCTNLKQVVELYEGMNAMLRNTAQAVADLDTQLASGMNASS